MSSLPNIFKVFLEIIRARWTVALFQGKCEVACDVLSELEKSSITKEILEVREGSSSLVLVVPSCRHPRPRLGKTEAALPGYRMRLLRSRLLILAY
ncbi:hypothetical protein Y032_0253g251 [Ancylostoma ceylanicum]|uniref:Uncharacterized protein n=1 Tax=Ancylostoma ceylanicum TaxID=53326 RepID=A0A016SBG0_9BILA|nr:hypothetical protein Y032_0253g251 [Ancylostoma ceylanicum]